MREVEFREWLEAQGYDPGTVRAQIDRANRLARAYGDLDMLAENGGLDRLQRELAYSKEDERAGKANPSTVTIDGNIYNGLSSLRATLNYYRQFTEASREGARRPDHTALVARLSASDVEATMDECDAAGVHDFLRAHGYVRPSNWAVRPSNGQRYPAKAIIGIAIGKLPDQVSLGAKAFFGGFGEPQAYSRLKELGYQIVGKDSAELPAQPLSREAVEAALNEFDTLGSNQFLAKYERGLQGTRYWVKRGDKTYPSKAIANAALESLTGQRDAWGGTEARRQLARLGYQIVDREGLTVSGGGEASAPAPHTRAVPDGHDTPDPVNLILYGPPGTGKTYATATEAVRLCNGEVPETREDVMAEYQALFRKGRISFVTFHQSYAYEEFVEGLRPDTEASEDAAGAGFSLRPHDGVFKQIADLAAENRGSAVAAEKPVVDRTRKVFKMSLGRAGIDDHIFEAAIKGGYVVLGWGGEIDWSDPKYDQWSAILERWRQDHPDATGNNPNVVQTYALRANMEVGSLVVISDGNSRFRAIGEITGPYQFVAGHDGEYNHRRPVKWLWHSDESLPRERIYGKSFSMVSAYQLNGRYLDWDALEQVVLSGGEAVDTTGVPEPYVLIIDEINRANISKVFGELITLLEPDKRIDAPNELRVKLPYSGDIFGIPANLHIIGTMNTADRSIALLDTALRRRFAFRELMPDAGMLPEQVDDVPLRAMLQRLNERIEYLFDREHQIGHAYFLGCETRDDVDARMRDRVIPLLTEYFYEDWTKVALVLGDGEGARFLSKTVLAPPPGLDADGDAPARWRWSVRKEFAEDAYAGFA